MAIGFYDYDTILKPKKLFLNLEAMKIAAYYNGLHEGVVLVDNIEDYKKFERFYVFRNIPEKATFFGRGIVSTISDSKVQHLGLAYTGGLYVPMEIAMEKQTPLPQIYAPYLREKMNLNGLTMGQLEKLLNSHFLRLRAGEYQTDLSLLKRKETAYIYDYEIERVDDWFEKLKYCRKELVNPSSMTRIKVQNGFKFTSFENIRKLSTIPGFKSDNVHLIYPCRYNEFQEEFASIAGWVSSRDGINYYYTEGVNPLSNHEIVKNLCLSINKYLYTKSINCACTFIAGDTCEDSPLYKLQKDFQYWTEVRVGDVTLEQYFHQRSKKSDEIYKMALMTPYGKIFKSLCSVTKNDVRKEGWYYHV